MTPRDHLAPFRESLRPWLVLGRNTIPVLGVHVLGWSEGITVFEIWFDGLSAFAAMFALQLWAFARDDSDLFAPPAGMPAWLGVVLAPVHVLAAFLLLGIPYWFVLGALHATVLDGAFWQSLPGRPWLLAALGAALVSNVVEQARRGFGRMSAAQRREEFNWEFHIHLAKIVALLIVGFFIPLAGITAVMLALSYVEIYPLRALRILGAEHTAEPPERRRLD